MGRSENMLDLLVPKAYTTAAAPRAPLGCGLMGSTLMGSLQKYYFLTDLKNVPTNAINLTDFDGY